MALHTKEHKIDFRMEFFSTLVEMQGLVSPSGFRNNHSARATTPSPAIVVAGSKAPILSKTIDSLWCLSLDSLHYPAIYWAK